MNWEVVERFEKRVAEFFGAPYAVAVDSCTHGIELCLRMQNAGYIHCPNRTYLSVPMLANKLNIKLHWDQYKWEKFYCVYRGVYDAAVLWEKDSYLNGTLMCISFQHQKHLSLGRGGMILCPNEFAATELKMMSYDGRMPGIPWREQDIDRMGYHYYMTPETAEAGLNKLPEAIVTPPRKWTVEDWPDLTQMKIFKK